jgi:hypothetical protein
LIDRHFAKLDIAYVEFFHISSFYAQFCMFNPCIFFYTYSTYLIQTDVKGAANGKAS